MIEHEQYYRKGGTYELPIEIYNDLIGQIEEAQKEGNDYKSRCKKAMKYINHYLKGINNLDDVLINSNILKEIDFILNGSDEK